MTNEIKIYNTKTRSLEAFVPLTEGKVGIYSCGPTVYHYAHIGNLRAYVFADVLKNMFKSSGYEVRHVINITDVGHLVGDGDSGEDKLESGAKREGKSAYEVAKFYEEAFMGDLAKLGINTSEFFFPRATENIPEQITLIQSLEEKGFTYRTSDGIYFDTSKFEDYPLLAKLDIEGLKSGARVEENKEKRNISDFALWKFSPENEKRQMEWDSPWGRGFPGWHIECSAMSMKYLGKHFDIHTGGIDHIPVHHTNEIAQSECATSETYVNYWMHVNFLNDTTGKMSKSNGDFLTLKSLTEKGYNPMAYRYLLLTAHYRKELAFSFEALDAASIAFEKLSEWIGEREMTGAVNDAYMAQFKACLCDDVGTPGAIALMWTILKDEKLPEEERAAIIREIAKVLGIVFLEKEEIIVTEELENLLNERKLAREAKDFEESDRIRDLILEKGFIVKDTAKGQELSKA